VGNQPEEEIRVLRSEERQTAEPDTPARVNQEVMSSPDSGVLMSQMEMEGGRDEDRRPERAGDTSASAIVLDSSDDEIDALNQNPETEALHDAAVPLKRDYKGKETIETIREEKIAPMKESHSPPPPPDSVSDNANITEKTEKTENPDEPTNYLEEFLHILKSVLETKSHLFAAEESKLLFSLLDSSDGVQRLSARLLNRKTKWFQTKKVAERYTDNNHMGTEEVILTSLDSMVKNGISISLFCEDMSRGTMTPEATAIEALHFLLVTDLKVILQKYPDLTPKKDTKKISIISSITDALQPDQKVATGMSKWLGMDSKQSLRRRAGEISTFIKEVSGPCIAMSPLLTVAWRKVQRCFFLNAPIEAFVLSRMGKFRFPGYTCDPSPVFTSAVQLTEYDIASLLSEEFELFKEDRMRLTKLQFSEALDTFMRKILSSLVKRSPVWAGEWVCDGVFLTPCCVKNDSCGASFSSKSPLNICRCSFELEKKVGSKENRIKIAGFLHRFDATWVYLKLVLQLVNLLENESRHGEAIALTRRYLRTGACPGKRGYAWERLTIDLQRHAQEPQIAMEACEAALDDAWLQVSRLPPKTLSTHLTLACAYV